MKPQCVILVELKEKYWENPLLSGANHFAKTTMIIFSSANRTDKVYDLNKESYTTA